MAACGEIQEEGFDSSRASEFIAPCPVDGRKVGVGRLSSSGDPIVNEGSLIGWTSQWITIKSGNITTYLPVSEVRFVSEGGKFLETVRKND